MQVSEVLERTLDRLEMGGWIKCEYRNEDGDCLVGALYGVISEQYTWQGGGQALMIACTRVLRQQTGIANLTWWNDQPGRTMSQVREVLRRGICEAGMGELIAA